MNEKKLSQTISYILRHHPEKYHIQLDEEGWVDIDILLNVLKQKFGELSIEDIQHMMDHSDKKRYEIKEHRIRAYYGHSLAQKIVKKPLIPPQYLYHGTSKQYLPSILEKGLLPMKRQYVHLSSDEITANIVGKRHDKNPIILKIDAQKAHLDGILFYGGNDQVWLADHIPSQYILDDLFLE